MNDAPDDQRADRDRRRAECIRLKVYRRTASEIDLAWLARWEVSATARRPRHSRPPVDIEPVVKTICRDHGVTLDELREKGRARRPEVKLARRLLVRALNLAGSTPSQIGEVLGRPGPIASKMIGRAKHAAGLIDDRANALLIDARGAAAGEVVMLPVVVGSEAWCYLDRLAEIEEITGAAIAKAALRAGLGLRTRTDHAVGAE